MGSFAGSLTHQQTYLKSVAALGKFAIPPGEVSELSGPVATEKYFVSAFNCSNTDPDCKECKDKR
jgi:hypothetical protein